MQVPVSAVMIVAHGDGGEERLNTNVQHLRDQLAKALDLPVVYGLLKEPETFAVAHECLQNAAHGRLL
ncbi:hypothetical protein, partial [Clostridium perfringens]